MGGWAGFLVYVCMFFLEKRDRERHTHAQPDRHRIRAVVRWTSFMVNVSVSLPSLR